MIKDGEDKIDRHPLQGLQQSVGVPCRRGGCEDELLGELHEHGARFHVRRDVQGLPARIIVRQRVQQSAVRHREQNLRDRCRMETV